MSVHCPRCEEAIPEKVFKDVREWGPEAMKCPYCNCPLNKSIFEQRHWDQLFPVPEKKNDDMIGKTKEVASHLKRSAIEFKKDYFG